VKFVLFRALLLLLFLGLTRSLVADDLVQVDAPQLPAEALDAQAMQYEQMLKPKMWKELEFIRQTCNLTREQRPKIKAAALASVKTAAKQLIQQMRQPQLPGAENQPALTIRKDLEKALETTLTKEQLASYQEATAKRSAALKSTTIKSVVSQLDGFLYLTREQRDKITAGLDKNWKESWEPWLMIWQYGGSYFPMIPDEHVVPHLNEKQKSVWQGAQKVNPSVWSGGHRQQPDDPWWDGKEETETKGGDAAPAKKTKQ
jgi:hypothetical protein